MADDILTINGKTTDNSGSMTLTPADLGAVATSVVGANNGVASLGSDGKIPSSQIPALAISETFTVASQAAMLALTAQRGDVAIRTDQSNRAYILTTDAPSVLANWVNINQGLAVALQALSGLTPAADQMPYFDSSTTAALALITAFGRSIQALTNAAAARTLFGLDYSTISQNIPTSSLKNQIINGGFDLFQRGLSFTSTFASGAYTADRWVSNGAANTLTVSQFSTVLGSTYTTSKYGALFSVTSVAGANNFSTAQQRMEGVTKLAGKTITVSFTAYSSVANKKIGFNIQQNFGSGGSPSSGVNTNGQSQLLTTTATRYSLTFAVPSIAGKTIGTNNNDYTELVIWLDAGSAFDARTGACGQMTANVAMHDIQVEINSVATEFESRPLSLETSLCERFFKKSYDLATPPGSATNTGMVDQYLAAATTAALSHVIFFNSRMRSAPSTVIYDTAGNPGKVFRGAQNQAVGVVIPSQASMIVVVPAGNSATEYAFQWTADAEL